MESPSNFNHSISKVENSYKCDKQKFFEFVDMVDKTLNDFRYTSETVHDFRSLLKLFTFLLDKPEVYVYKESAFIKKIIDFVLDNITQVNKNNGITLESLNYLLNLLSNVLIGINMYLSNYEMVDKIRIQEVLESIIDLFKNLDVLNLCVKIFNNLVELKRKRNNTSDVSKILVLKMLNFFKNEHYVFQLCSVMQTILKNGLLSLFFEPVVEWILDSSFSYIDSKDEELSQTIVTTLITFIKKDCINKDEIYCEFINKLLKKSDAICELVATTSFDVEDSPIDLLGLILNHMFEKEQFTFGDTTLKCTTLDLDVFRRDIKYWIKEDSVWFLYICHMLLMHCSRLLWSKKKILRVLSKRLYLSEEIELPVLKSMLYLYPCLIAECLDPANKALGTDLLNKLTDYSFIPEVYSFKETRQLAWILSVKQADMLKDLKLRTLRIWLINCDPAKFENTVKICKAGSILLQIMLDEYDKEMGIRAAKILPNIKDKDLSENILISLTKYAKRPELWKYLLQAGPAVSNDSESQLLHCTLMGIMIAYYIDDTETLIGICKYTCQLLVALKKDPQCIEAFCKNTTNIKKLIKCTIESKQKELTCAVLHVFNNLLKIQKINKYSPKKVVEEDFSQLLGKSSEQNTVIVEFFSNVFSLKEPILQPTNGSIIKIYHHFLNGVGAPKLLPEKYHKTLYWIIKRHEWLALSPSTAAFVQMQCSRKLNDETEEIFSGFIYNWANIVLHSYKSFMFFPTEGIKNYVIRIDKKHISDKIVEILDSLEEELGVRANNE